MFELHLDSWNTYSDAILLICSREGSIVLFLWRTEAQTSLEPIRTGSDFALTTLMNLTPVPTVDPLLKRFASIGPYVRCFSSSLNVLAEVGTSLGPVRTGTNVV